MLTLEIGFFEELSKTLPVTLSSALDPNNKDRALSTKTVRTKYIKIMYEKYLIINLICSPAQISIIYLRSSVVPNKCSNKLFHSFA